VKTEKPRRAIRLALLASSNLDLLQRPLVTRLLDKGFAAELWNPGFNQYRQAILDPSSGLYESKSECIVLLLDAADLFADYLLHPYDCQLDNVPSVASAAADDVSSLVQTIASRLPSATVFLNTLFVDTSGTYCGLEYNSNFTFRQVVSSYNARLRELTRTLPNAIVVDVELLAASTGLDRWYDPRLWYLGRIRYSSEAHGLLALEYAKFIAARWGDVRKCIVVDLDNTLWGGIIGEDGIAGIQLGHEGVGLAFVEFQRELRSLRQKGILLAICSKNNSVDAYEAIRNHPAMVLREKDFAAAEINWSDKADNIRKIASRLNIGLESLVFVDDSQFERQRVKDQIPEVEVPEWPQDPCDYKRALSRVASEYFLKLNVTDEDRGRGEMYSAQAERTQLAETATSLEEFYVSLQMKLTITRVNSQTLARVSQLTQKTNQFNLTTRRYTEAEIAGMSGDPRCLVYCLDLRDRFGSNGIVGVLILRKQPKEEWYIDTFLMSCRVIGRTVEEALLGCAVRELRELGASYITGEFIPTTKNMMVASLYEKLGFTRIDTGNERAVWGLDLKRKTLAVPEWFEICTLEGTTAQ
jgi:FkbH-like protein